MLPDSFRSVQRKGKTPGFSHLSDFAEQFFIAFPNLFWLFLALELPEKPRWSPTQILSEVGPQSEEISAPNTHHLQTPTLGPDVPKPPNKQLLGWGLVA